MVPPRFPGGGTTFAYLPWNLELKGGHILLIDVNAENIDYAAVWTTKPKLTAFGDGRRSALLQCFGIGDGEIGNHRTELLVIDCIVKGITDFVSPGASAFPQSVDQNELDMRCHRNSPFKDWT